MDSAGVVAGLLLSSLLGRLKSSLVGSLAMRTWRSFVQAFVVYRHLSRVTLGWFSFVGELAGINAAPDLARIELGYLSPEKYDQCRVINPQ